MLRGIMAGGFALAFDSGARSDTLAAGGLRRGQLFSFGRDYWFPIAVPLLAVCDLLSGNTGWRFLTRQKPEPNGRCDGAPPLPQGAGIQ